MALTSSGAKQLATRMPDACIVSAFCMIPSEVPFGVFERRNDVDRPSLVYCGDDANSEQVATELICDAGFDPIDAGGLRFAWYIEPHVLVAEIAYGSSEGPQLSYRFQWG